MNNKDKISELVPSSCKNLLEKDNRELRSAIPELARDWGRMMDIEKAVGSLETSHRFIRGDARNLEEVDDGSVHMVLTSPPYFDIKDYNESRGQLGSITDFDQFSSEVSKVWKECYDKLVPNGRMCIITGDVLQSRSKVGRHRVIPLHSTIQHQCLDAGFDCLSPIIWSKIGNATLEAGGNSRFLGKPYEPGGVVKNDIEYILMFRKKGEYRSPSKAERILSTIQVDEHCKLFKQIWTELNGAKDNCHPAPFPKELAARLIKMCSFIGDRILDPFAGTGTTALAASELGRNTINFEIDREYLSIARDRVRGENRVESPTFPVESS